MYDVITVGSATVDVFAKTQFSELIKIMNPRGETDLLAYPSGSKILIEELDFTTGGGGTNTAVSLARLGHKAAFLGKLGNDHNAKIILDELRKEGVADLSIKAKGMSGFSIILNSIEDDRTILAYKGVNDELKFSEIKLSRLKAEWFYFSSMLGNSFRTQEKLAKYAKRNSIKILFNPSLYLAEKGHGYLQNILRSTEVLILNKEEAMALLGRQNQDIKALLKMLTKLGPRIAVVTDGKRGAYAYDHEHFYFTASPKVKVVETTGAGDAFASAFLSGLIKRGAIEFAMQLGTANAISVIQHHGAKNKLLRLKEALQLIRRYKIKVMKRRVV